LRLFPSSQFLYIRQRDAANKHVNYMRRWLDRLQMGFQGMDSSSIPSEPATDEKADLVRRHTRQGEITCFGPQAQRWGARLSAGSPCVLADCLATAEALEEATQRRRSEALLTGPVLDEPRSLIARQLAPQILARESDFTKRRLMFDALARNTLVLDSTVQSSVPALDERVKTTLRDLYLVGVATIVRSRRQAAYLGGLFGRYRPGFIVRPGLDEDVPSPTPAQRGDSLVIWAPNMELEALAIHLFALADVRAPIVVIGASGDAGAFPNIHAVSMACATRELSRAALVIDATLSDPASAVALAAWDVPVVAASSSGADEFLASVRLYDPWNWRSIAAAVAAARADAPTFALSGDRSPPLRARSASATRRTRHEPLVTIVVPTFNRTAILPFALTSLEDQSYANLEILVVNDGGPPIDDIVSRYPRARSIANAQNIGMYNSINVGIAHARGEYIGLLADDDIYYFDHVERNVAALEQSHGQVARANALTRFLEPDAAGVLRTTGNQVLFAAHQDVTEALWWGSLGAALVRRDAYARVGAFDATNALAEYEMLVRLSRSFDFIHVDHVTFEWRYRSDRSTYVHQVGTGAMLDGLKRIYDTYPSHGDMIVEQGRAATLAFMREHSATPYFQPALRLETDVKQ
jgi:hypothetical protein